MRPPANALHWRQAVDSGGLQSALFFLLHCAEILAFHSAAAMVGVDNSQHQQEPEHTKAPWEEGGGGDYRPQMVVVRPAAALGAEPALQGALIQLARLTKGKGGLGRVTLATLDYLLGEYHSVSAVAGMFCCAYREQSTINAPFTTLVSGLGLLCV